MLLCFFLLLELNRVVKRFCCLNSLSGKYICLNVYYRPTANRLNMGEGNHLVSNSGSMLLRSRLCAFISKSKSYPSFSGFSFIHSSPSFTGITYASGKATAWEFCGHFEANFKIVFPKLFLVQCGIPPILERKTRLASVSPKRKVTRSWRIVCNDSTSVSFAKKYKANSFTSYSCNTMNPM